MKKTEYSLSPTKANAIGLILAILIVLLYASFFFLNSSVLESFRKHLIIIKNLTVSQRTPYVLFTVFVFLIGIILHEAIHGFFFAIFNSKGWKAVMFGFSKKMMVPYAHCKEPVKVKHFRIAVIMPTIILGILPLFIYLFTDSFWVWIFSLMFTIAGGGDLIVLWMVRKLEANKIIKDHPSKLGYILFEDV